MSASYSGTACKTVSGSLKTQLIITYALASQDVTANKSTITLRAYVYFSGSGSTSSSYSSGYFTLNGKTVKSNGTYSLSSGQTKLMGSTTITVAHNSDGSFPSTSFSYGAKSYHWSSGTSGTATIGAGKIKSIARASTISATNATCGSASTVSVTRANSSYWHAITAKVGSYSCNVTSGRTQSTSISWTVPTDMEKYITSSTSGTVTLTCTTYTASSGGTNLGSKTCTMTATVRSSVVPTIGSISITESGSGVGTFLSGYSTATIKASDVAGAQGSSILAVSYKLDSVSGQLSGSNGAYSISTKSLPNGSDAGTSYTLTVTATDTRGRAASKTASVTVYAYSPPSISTFTAVRCDSSGTASETGECVLATFAKTDASTCGGTNKTTANIEYKLHTASDYATAKSGAVSPQLVDAVTISANQAYDIRLSLSDTFSTVTKTVTVMTTYSLLEFNKSKKGIAIGKASEYNAFEIAMPTYPYKELLFEAGKMTSAMGMHWKNADSSANHHDAHIYGGSPDSGVCVGIKDNQNGRMVFAYTDADNKVVLGNSESTVQSSGKLTAPNIACGKVQVAPNANSTVSTSVSFGKTFPAIPQVTVTPQTTVPNKCWCSVGGVTTTGFTLYFYRTDSTSTGISWIAIGG